MSVGKLIPATNLPVRQETAIFFLGLLVLFTQCSFEVPKYLNIRVTADPSRNKRSAVELSEMSCFFVSVTGEGIQPQIIP